MNARASVSPSAQRALTPPHPPPHPGRLSRKETNSAGRARALPGSPQPRSATPQPRRTAPRPPPKCVCARQAAASQRPPARPDPCRPLTGRHGDPEPRPPPPRRSSAGPRRARGRHHDAPAPGRGGPAGGEGRRAQGMDANPAAHGAKPDTAARGRPSSAPDVPRADVSTSPTSSPAPAGRPSSAQEPTRLGLACGWGGHHREQLPLVVKP